jgi:hypothetical protein
MERDGTPRDYYPHLQGDVTSAGGRAGRAAVEPTPVR